ncbi:hypothetical protein FE374_04630 [Georgenia yuyongxinii]|uniref:YoaR-like putative peptidoglycan binding domain-containing protein n=1 Tax=Georgenia yuyongxinii TaxID=2589797 RepID=A0A5B8C005_9MICO|nr:VanW family protein [Georgenia yuyongxinii]QDC24009.1 hypothetical protein FE374_04630 [Georgenia yuyongxinii]
MAQDSTPGRPQEGGTSPMQDGATAPAADVQPVPTTPAEDEGAGRAGNGSEGMHDLDAVLTARRQHAELAAESAEPAAEAGEPAVASGEPAAEAEDSAVDEASGDEASADDAAPAVDEASGDDAAPAVDEASGDDAAPAGETQVLPTEPLTRTTSEQAKTTEVEEPTAQAEPTPAAAAPTSAPVAEPAPTDLDETQPAEAQTADAAPATTASRIEEAGEASASPTVSAEEPATAETEVVPAQREPDPEPATEPLPATEHLNPAEPSAPTEAVPAAGRPSVDAAPAADQPTERLRPMEEPMPAASPLAVFPAERKPDQRTGRRRRRGLIAAAIVVGVLAIAYVAGAWFLGDRVPGGTVVAGVHIGGLAEDEARDRLQTELAAVQTEPVPVTIGEEAIATIDPAAAGLQLDVDATLDDLVGFSLAPTTMWSHLFGGGEAPAVSTADDDALRTAVEAAAGALDLAPVEGSISYVGTTPQPTEPAPGKAVDIEAAQEYLLTRWLADERPLSLPTTEVAPHVGADAVDEAMSNLAEPLVSGPVAVSVDGQLAELTPEALAAHATFVDVDGALDLQLDGAALANAVHDVNPEIGVAGEDAKIILNANAEPEIVPSTSGQGLDPDALASAVTAAGTSTDRTATVELVDAEPEFTTAEAEALGVKEIVADFSTPMPYDPVRTRNLQVGAEKITGVLVMPGEEFSLLEALGPITAANGFVSSGVVEDGFSSTALGGGLSQLSTNTYNVGLMAGMDDVEHKPHSRWFSRYPAGREATLWEPTVDMVWRNNTDYGILVHAWVTSNAVHTRLWSTQVWDVDISTSNHYNITQPTTVYNTNEPCVAESGGQYGFTVTVTRERSRAGQAPETQDWSWTYQPWNRVVCGEKPAPEPEPAPEASPAA